MITQEKNTSTSKCKIPLKKIGIFDSGIGGLYVTDILMRHFPADYYYLADTAFAPYGDKSIEELSERLLKIYHYFEKNGVQTLISACHTASVISLLNGTQCAINFIPIAKKLADCVAQESLSRIGIMGTVMTISSHFHKSIIQKNNQSINIFEQACPGLATAIEENDSHTINLLLENYLPYFSENEVESIVLACTHYSFIKKEIYNFFNYPIKLFAIESYGLDLLQDFIPIKKKSTLSLSVTGAQLKVDLVSYIKQSMLQKKIIL